MDAQGRGLHSLGNPEGLLKRRLPLSTTITHGRRHQRCLCRDRKRRGGDTRARAIFRAISTQQIHELAEDLGTLVCGDPELLHRLFDNLLRNALTHARAGGWVGISLATRDGDAADESVVRVEDRGPGVPDSDLEQLFLPFYRGRSRIDGHGYGLGLTIARQIVDQHRGQIEAANRHEGGLCLTVVLPLAKVPD